MFRWGRWGGFRQEQKSNGEKGDAILDGVNTRALISDLLPLRRPRARSRAGQEGQGTSPAEEYPDEVSDGGDGGDGGDVSAGDSNGDDGGDGYDGGGGGDGSDGDGVTVVVLVMMSVLVTVMVTAMVVVVVVVTAAMTTVVTVVVAVVDAAWHSHTVL